MIPTHSFPEKFNIYPRMKKKKHSKIVNDYDKQKSKHLEKLANKMLENDEKLSKLKGKNINTNFLDLF
jgi:signal recognition particle subunit SEC65